MDTKIILSSEEEFFKRGKAISKVLDNSLPIIQIKIISFEDIEDLSNFLIDFRKEPL